MKKFWICLFLATVAGTATAWAINFQRYGHRVARFGPFTMDSDVEAVLAARLAENPDGLARVELLGEPTHDFGMMSPDTEGEHVFVIKNVGEEDLTLRLGATTCKCTLGELDSDRLKPGEQTEIKLSWKVRGGEPDFEQSAQVITNDPKNVVINLAIIGKIIQDVEVVPETWTFGEVATGEEFEVTGTIYNYLPTDIRPTEMRFSSEELTELSEFEVEPFVPTSETDGIRSAARQGFRVTIKVKPGMRQGAVSQSFLFGFERLDEDGKVLPPEGENAKATEYIVASTKGQIVGPLGMISNSKLQGSIGGGYVYDFGRLEEGDSLVANTFVVFKGSERDKTKLSIGEITPEGVIRATLGEPKGRGSVLLYPLRLELVRGDEPVERLGSDKDDYGSVWIESDNPKVTRMRVALRFAIEGK